MIPLQVELLLCGGVFLFFSHPHAGPLEQFSELRVRRNSTATRSILCFAALQVRSA
ncbi:MAG TPA: hypothetical protein DER32_09980, partial [Deinococcus radiodurans]|nr:hypothetical protein [Deinococcus radiodurans]